MAARNLSKLAFAVAFLAGSLGSARATDFFGADNPTWGQFIATCRTGQSIRPECRGSVLGAYAEHAKTTPAKVVCNFRIFWRTVDGEQSGRVALVLPWQYGLAFIVEKPGICSHR